MMRSNILAALLLVASAFWALAGAMSGATSVPGMQKPPGSAEIVSPLSGSAAAPPSAVWAQQVASTLSSVDAPGRDLISITQRLKLHGAGNIPTTVNATQPNYAVGSRQRFYVADISNKTYHTVNSTLKVVTAHAYWNVGDGYKVDQQALTAAARYFEDHVYPTDRRVFGPEPYPGID